MDIGQIPIADVVERARAAGVPEDICKLVWDLYQGITQANERLAAMLQQAQTDRTAANSLGEILVALLQREGGKMQITDEELEQAPGYKYHLQVENVEGAIELSLELEPVEASSTPTPQGASERSLH